MGLEIVELFMRVEEEFGIGIEDEEASQIHTVGQLHSCILGKLGMLDTSHCQSSATFYQTRCALMKISGVNRASIRPNSPIETLLPIANRRAGWANLEQTMSATLPPLERPRWQFQMLRACVILALVASLITLFASPARFWATAILSSFALIMLAKWSEVAATELPENCATVGGMVKSLLHLNYGINAQKRDPQSAEQIWEKLREIMVDELSVEPEEITPDAHFVRDLHLG